MTLPRWTIGLASKRSNAVSCAVHLGKPLDHRFPDEYKDAPCRYSMTGGVLVEVGIAELVPGDSCACVLKRLRYRRAPLVYAPAQSSGPARSRQARVAGIRNSFHRLAHTATK